MTKSKCLKRLLASTICAAGFVSGMVCAAPLPAASFQLDTLLGSANLSNSGDASELAAMKTFVPDFTGTLPKNTTSGNSALAIRNPGTTDQWYIDLGSATPGYFLLKFGTGGTYAQSNTFFFENSGEMTKLVFSDAQVDFLSGGPCGKHSDACNIGRLSHYASGGTVESTGGEVPEPASLALMGLGLAALGLGLGRRRGN